MPKPTTSRVVQADVLSPANIVACSDGLPFPARSFEVDSRPESTTQLLHFPGGSPETCRPTGHAHSLQSPASAIAHLPCCHTSTLPTRADALAPRTLLLRVCTRPAVHQPLNCLPSRQFLQLSKPPTSANCSTACQRGSCQEAVSAVSGRTLSTVQLLAKHAVPGFVG